MIVVENDDGMRRALQRMLEISGFATETFESAEALLAVDAATRARCLVLDIQLPGISGFELHRRLHAAEVSPPVVYITGYDSAAARDQSVALGAVAYLPKPFAVELLVDAVSRASGMPPRASRDRSAPPGGQPRS